MFSFRFSPRISSRLCPTSPNGNIITSMEFRCRWRKRRLASSPQPLSAYSHFSSSSAASFPLTLPPPSSIPHRFTTAQRTSFGQLFRCRQGENAPTTATTLLTITYYDADDTVAGVGDDDYFSIEKRSPCGDESLSSFVPEFPLKSTILIFVRHSILRMPTMLCPHCLRRLLQQLPVAIPSSSYLNISLSKTRDELYRMACR